jgi:hypothetical protein
MKRIKLTKGKYALVDDVDFAELNQYKWFYSGGYAARHDSRAGLYYDGKMHGHGRLIGMHRYILGDPEGLEVDHINLNKLDNRRANLRAVTKAVNALNKPIYKNSKLGLPGVVYQQGKYLARIRFRTKSYYLGYFTDALEAYAVCCRKKQELMKGTI